MYRRLIFLILSIVLLASCSQTRYVSEEGIAPQKNKWILKQKESVPASFFPDPIRVVSIGDSLTEGVGDSRSAGGYLPYLENRLSEEPSVTSVEMVNLGVRGNRSDQLLSRLEKEETKRELAEADAVVITIGGNDIMKVVRSHFTNLEMKQFETAREEYEGRLEQILDLIRLNNEEAQIYLLGVYNPFSQWFNSMGELDLIMDEWNESSKAIVDGYSRSKFIDIDDIFTNGGAELLYTEDYFHPNDEGYQLIAERIYTNMDIKTLGDTSLTVRNKGDE